MYPRSVLQVVAFKSDGSVLLNELEVTLPHVAGEFCSEKGAWSCWGAQAVQLPQAQEAGQGGGL